MRATVRQADHAGFPEEVAAVKVVIDAERCKGCGLCVAVCPPGVLALGDLNAKGYSVAVLVDDEGCTSCTACALICPDAVITVMKPARDPAKARGRG